MAANTTCPKQMAATSNGAWQGDNPVNFALPLLILQICLVLAVTRILGVLLKPLRQPRVIAEIIGGILLGPSALGKNSEYIQKIFPQRSLTVLETVADLGLIFFLFLVGLELDLRAIRRTGSQALGIAAAGIAVPFVAGVGVSVVLHKTIATDGKFAPFLVFMGVALSITAFPVLARILAERKLLTTDIGQMAMSAAAVNDVVAWILLALAVALSGTGKSPLIAVWVLLSGLAFVVVMFLLIRPIMTYIARQTVENEPVSEMYVAITLAAVLTAGFTTDALGIHSIFGAFVFGLIIPKEGPFAGLLIEKLEDLVTILMLPLYFASSGLKTNIGSIHGARSFGLLVLVITVACAGKILGTFTVASLHHLSSRKALTLGFLMNTKGLVELIVLNIGKDRGVLNDETFAIMVLMALFTTFITTPVVMALYKPARNQVPYNRRTLYISNEDVKQIGPEAELRILAGVHGMPNVHAIINLVEAARGTRKRSLHMYILHLIELSERPSSIMKVQRVRRNGRPFWDDKDQQGMHGLDNIVVAFAAYGQLSKVMVRPMTAISRIDDMHEDICATANEKHAAIIILPFHKYGASPTDGQWEGQYPGFRSVNQKVLLHAPCSVGILIDRGIGMSSAPFSSSSVDQNIAVLFYGGPDDREALALGYRMAEHPGVKLTVYRFVFGDDVLEHATVVQVGDQNQGGSGGQLVRPTGSGGGWGVHSHSSGGDVHMRFSLSSRFSIGPHETYDFMSTADVDWAHESKLDEECLALAKARRFVPGAGAGADQLSIGAGANTSTATSGVGAGAVAAGGVASPSIVYVEKAISSINKDDAVNAALEIVKSGGISLVVVGRGRRPSLLLAPLASRQAEFQELGPIGDALVGLHHQGIAAGADQQAGEGRAGRQPSVLVVQQHDTRLVQELVVSGSRRRHQDTSVSGGGNKLAAKVVDISSPIQKASALLSPHLVVVTGPSSSSQSEPPSQATEPDAQA